MSAGVVVVAAALVGSPIRAGGVDKTGDVSGGAEGSSRRLRRPQS